MAKKPSTRFPFINLSKALERAQAVFEADRGGKGLTMPVAFSAWGYSDKSSGGFQTVGALKGYGLLTDEGSNEARVVRLTDDARLYFQSELPEDKQRLRAGFARTPQLMAHLLDHWGEGTVDDPVARTYLKTVIGLNEQSARSALGIYKDNLSFAGIKGSAKGEVDNAEAQKDGDKGGGIDFLNTVLDGVFPPPNSTKVGDKVQWTSQGIDQFPLPRTVERVFRDPERGWFVTVVGEKGSIPMDQVTVAKDTPPTAVQSAVGGTATPNPIEVFMTADKRLRISADVDGQGLDKLIDMLEKYKAIVTLQ